MRDDVDGVGEQRVDNEASETAAFCGSSRQRQLTQTGQFRRDVLPMPSVDRESTYRRTR
jgi:hypothetical protein